jgi:SAM-dependent methyltransferase
MHRSSYEKMQAFRQAYLSGYAGSACAILDVGSASFGGDDGYLPLFDDPNWRYTGLDLAPARNVDLVVRQSFSWKEIADRSFDVVVSGQAFEHIAWPWLTMMEIARVLRPGGLAALTAPSSGHAHRYPLDCWRFYPDGFPALAAYAGMTLLEQHIDDGYAFPENAFWGDVFVVLKRPRREEADEEAWRLRHAAAMESVRGIDPRGVPALDDGFDAIARRSEASLRGLDARKVKRELIAEALRRAWRVTRTPLARLKRP